ncbi:putative toxin-antitoxin system toxin component, PIN family [Candidatus Pacearchaeota archaeon]|nr:putative toxin-antitoxin system toxin component, PIN family [Candidatus Pacearchaeota archaeon]
MRIVIDTNFLISATQWDYSISHKLLKKLIMNETEIFTTKEILEEFTEVLKRDFKYNEEEIDDIIKIVLQFVTLVTPIKKIDVVKDDADDNKIIECAVESNAKYIISYDKHLLNLGEYLGIKIIRPEEAFGIA